MISSLSWAEARRIALRSQGMGPARRTAVPGRAESLRSLQRTVASTHLLQIDSVSVFARAHHLPVFTRTGSWDTSALAVASEPGPRRTLQEALAHEAAFTTPEVHQLLAFRRARTAHRDWGAVRSAAASDPEVFTRIIATLQRAGPLSASAISRALDDHDRGEGWGWRRTRSQWAVEYLFRTGMLDCVGRSSQFERLYIPAEGASAPAIAERAGTEPKQDPRAVRELVTIAARALGIASVGSLADYFRLRQSEIRPAVTELIARGELAEVDVALPERPQRMLLHREAPAPAPLRCAALVSPFDPIVFHRPRLRSLFDVDYRIGIYTPAHRRSTGYYSLLFLHGDRIPALVDLRADRTRSVLEVCGIFAEGLPRTPHRSRPDPDAVLGALAGELRRAATWQGLERIEVPRGPGSEHLEGGLRSLIGSTAPPISP